jgi:aldehyde:ferredoxin oxidoreductase
MELNEKNIIKYKIKFGEKNKLKDIISLIAEKRDIGEELSLGSKRFSKKFNAIKFSMQTKGLELPAYDPRGAHGIGLSYATSNRGACHLRGGYSIGPEILGTPRMINRFSYIGKAGYVIDLQNFGAVIDSLVVCRFATFALSEIFWARLLSCVTGIDFKAEELIKIGERIFNLERVYNIREGFISKDDTLPERLLKEKVKDGPSKGNVVHLKEMLEEYYQHRNWDKNGIPKNDKLKELEVK